MPSFEETLARMKGLYTYGKELNESNNVKSHTLEKYETAANGTTYGIVRECNKYYIKTAKKGLETIAEAYDYIGGYCNKANNEYASFSKVEDAFRSKMLSIRESVEGEANANTNDFASTVLMTEGTEKMKSEIARQRQIMYNASMLMNEASEIGASRKDDVVKFDGKNPGAETGKKGYEGGKKATANPAYAGSKTNGVDKKVGPFDQNAPKCADQLSEDCECGSCDCGKKDWGSEGIGKGRDPKSIGWEMEGQSTVNEEEEDWGSKGLPSTPGVGEADTDHNNGIFNKTVNEGEDSELDLDSDMDSDMDTDIEGDDMDIDMGIDDAEGDDLGAEGDIDSDLDSEDDFEDDDITADDDLDSEDDLEGDDLGGDDDLDSEDDLEGDDLGGDDDIMAQIDELQAQIDALKAQIGGGDEFDTEDDLDSDLDAEDDFDSEDDFDGEDDFDSDFDSEDDFSGEGDEFDAEGDDFSADDEFDGESDESFDDDMDECGMMESKRSKMNSIIESVVSRILKEDELHDFGKHPGYRKKPMELPTTGEDKNQWGEDWNDESVHGEEPFGKQIGNGDPFNQIVNAITKDVMAKIAATKSGVPIEKKN